MSDLNPNDLDLHGVKHADADVTIEEHVLLHTPPFKIITGNSEPMKKICKEVLKRHDFKYMEGDMYNLGYISVL